MMTTTTTTTTSIVMTKQQIGEAAEPASDLVELLLRLLMAPSSSSSSSSETRCWIDDGFVRAAVVAVGATGTGAIAVDKKKKKNRYKFLKAHRAFLKRRFWCYRRICFEGLIVPRSLAPPDRRSPDLWMMKRCVAILAYRYARVIVTASAASQSESELAVVHYTNKNMSVELPVLRGGLHLRRRHRRLATQEEGIKAILVAQKLLSRGATSVETTFRAVDHNVRRAAPTLKALFRMLLTHVVIPTVTCTLRGTWTVAKAYVKALRAAARVLALLLFVILPRITFKVVVVTARVLYCVLAVIGSCMWWAISAGLAVDTDYNAASVPAKKKKKMSHWSLMEDTKDRKVNDNWYRTALSPVPEVRGGVLAAPSRKRGLNVVTEVVVAPTMKKIKSQAVRTMEAKRSLNLQDDFYRKLAMAAQRWATSSFVAASYQKQVLRPFRGGDVVKTKYGRAARFAAAKQSLADHEAYLRAQALARTRRY